MARTKFTESDKAIIKAMLSEGCGWTEIGRCIGKKPATIRIYWKRKNGKCEKMRETKPWSKEEEQRLIELRDGGMVFSEIGKVMGRGESSVRKKYLLLKDKDHTLCWECKRTALDCPWLDEYVPVAGWKARKTAYEKTHSYVVYECPLFVKNEKLQGEDKGEQDLF